FGKRPPAGSSKLSARSTPRGQRNGSPLRRRARPVAQAYQMFGPSVKVATPSGPCRESTPWFVRCSTSPVFGSTRSSSRQLPTTSLPSTFARSAKLAPNSQAGGVGSAARAAGAASGLGLGATVGDAGGGADTAGGSLRVVGAGVSPGAAA